MSSKAFFYYTNTDVTSKQANVQLHKRQSCYRLSAGAVFRFISRSLTCLKICNNCIFLFLLSLFSGVQISSWTIGLMQSLLQQFPQSRLTHHSLTPVPHVLHRKVRMHALTTTASECVAKWPLIELQTQVLVTKSALASSGT